MSSNNSERSAVTHSSSEEGMMLTVMVTDVDVRCRKAEREVASIGEELHGTIYGERQYSVEDLDCHALALFPTRRDVNPKEWATAAASK
jgi:uncharacterized glyoxalase superfamily protein PhnB